METERRSQELDELMRRVGQAKAIVDSGMCRVGPRLDPARSSDGWLSGAASRALGLSDAVVALCRHGRPNEALPVLRQLAETAAAMRWLAAALPSNEEEKGGQARRGAGSGAGDPERRAASLSAELREARWDRLWEQDRFLSRAREAGVPAAEAQETLALASQFACGGSSSAPLSHVFAGNQAPGADAGRVLRLAVRWLGHALQALETRWPGSFPGAETLWSP